MRYRILGRTGLKVSEIGYGCWGIGGKHWGEPDDEESRKAIREALSRGVTFFDTALVYGDGHSERLLGEELADKKVVVATKVPPLGIWPPGPHSRGDDVFPEKYVVSCATQSALSLGRPIDLLQLHAWQDNWLDAKGWQRAFDKLRDDGVAKHFGVSINDHSPDSALRLAASGKVDCLQVIYNIFDQSPEDGLFQRAKDQDVGVIARVPFDEGSLTGTFTPHTRFEDWRKNYFTPERLAEVVERVDRLKFLEKDGRTLPQAALQFCLSNDAVSTVIPGMRRTQHVIENTAAASGRLSEDEIARLREARWDRNFYVR